MFAFYGNYMRWDGLIERLVYYEDHNYKDLIECHDFYERRKDMLKKRVYFIKQMKVIYFDSTTYLFFKNFLFFYFNFNFQSPIPL